MNYGADVTSIVCKMKNLSGKFTHMFSDSPGRVTQYLIPVVVGVIAAMGLSGCHPQSSQAEVNRKGLVDQAAQRSISPLTGNGGGISGFQKALTRLDHDADLVVYWNPARMLDEVMKNLGSLPDIISAGDPSLTPEEFNEMKRTLGLIQELVSETGVADIDGLGFSSRRVSDILHSHKVIIQKSTESDALIWRLFGNAVPIEEHLGQFPADTLVGFSGHFRAREALESLNKAILTHANSELVNSWIRMLDTLDQGMNIGRILQSSEGGIRFAVMADDSAMMPVPSRDGGFELPEPSMALSIQVKDDSILQLVRESIGETPLEPLQTDVSDAIGFSMKLRVPLPLEIRPTFIYHDGYFAVGTNPKAAQNLLWPGRAEIGDLAGTEEAKHWAGQFISPVNSMTFVSRRLGRLVGESFEKAFGAMDTENGPSANPWLGFRKIDWQNQQYFSVARVDEDGFYSETWTSSSPGQTAILFPIAVGAAKIVPGFMGARDLAESHRCIANLRTLGSAVRLHTNESGAWPESLDDLDREFLSSPGVYLCPSVIGRSDLSRLTKGGWQTFRPERDTSYIFRLAAAGYRRNQEDPVLAICPHHNHKLLTSGEVQSGDKQ